MRSAAEARLPVVDTWFESHDVGDGVTRVFEPHVSEFVRGNIWHVRGRDRDLIVDAGCGIASLREEMPELFANDPMLVVTHAHLDHMGGAYEFDDCRAHASEPLARPLRQNLLGRDLAHVLGMGPEVGELLPELLCNAIPRGDFDPKAYELRSAKVTADLAEGDVIDLGDRELQVLILPGHTPGSLALYEPDTRSLFSGDVIYDDGGVDALLDAIDSGDVGAYCRSMRRLAELDVRQVNGGHGDVFDGIRMNEIVDQYLSARSS